MSDVLVGIIGLIIIIGGFIVVGSEVDSWMNGCGFKNPFDFTPCCKGEFGKTSCGDKCCSKGYECCDDATKGPTCYNPKTQECKECGLLGCY